MSGEKKRRKSPLWVKIVVPIFVIGAVCIAIVLWGIYHLNFIKRTETQELVKVSAAEEDFEIDEDLVKEIAENQREDVVDPEDIDWGDADIDVMEDSDVANILLIGQDRREGQGRQRSDTMIICSINQRENKIILSSVMRDLYVPIPGYSDNRINAAYQFGGMPLLDQVMEESLGIHIDGNIEVDFESFIDSLAELGNLDLELNASEANYLNTHESWVAQAGTDATGWQLKEGMNSMTPEQVLAYARIRYVGNSDWERTDRQRKVLMAAFDKAKASGITGMMNLAKNVLPNLTTDMTNMQIMGYVYTILTNGITEIESYRIPAEGTYSCQTLSIGMEVLVPNLSANSQYLKEYIYGVESEE